MAHLQASSKAEQTLHVLFCPGKDFNVVRKPSIAPSIAATRRRFDEKVVNYVLKHLQELQSSHADLVAKAQEVQVQEKIELEDSAARKAKKAIKGVASKARATFTRAEPSQKAKKRGNGGSPLLGGNDDD